MMDLTYGTDPQSDAQPGDQVADTDGMALSRVGAFGPAATEANRLCRWWQEAADAMQRGDIGHVRKMLGLPEPATARPLPARALRPVRRSGGLHCGPF